MIFCDRENLKIFFVNIFFHTPPVATPLLFYLRVCLYVLLCNVVVPLCVFFLCFDIKNIILFLNVHGKEHSYFQVFFLFFFCAIFE